MPNRNAYGIVNPYGAGDALLNSNPYTAYYLRRESEKRAKDEALDKYFMDMEKSITPTGMRNQEVEPLIAMQKASQKFFQENKAAIKNPALDGGKARSAYFGQHQDKMSLIQQSKNEKAKEASISGVLKNPEVRSRIGETFFQKLDDFQKPLTDPTRVGSDDLAAELDFNAKRLTPQQQEQLFKQYGAAAGTVGKDRVVVGVDPNDPSKDLVEYKKAFTPKQLQAIGNTAALMYERDPSVKETFAAPSPEHFDELVAAGKKAYGDSFEILTPADAHKAEAIAHYLNQSAEKKSEVNKERQTLAANAEWRRRQAQRAADAEKRQDHAKALKKGQESEWLESQVKDAEDLAEKTPNAKIVITESGVPSKAVVLGMPAPVLKQFSINSGGQNIEPDAIAKKADGTFYPIFYKRESNKLPNGDDNPKAFEIVKTSNGGKVVDLTIPSQPMSRAQLKAAYGKAFATGNPLTSQFDGEEQPQQEAAPATGDWRKRAKPVKK